MKKLRNKKTGEIKIIDEVLLIKDDDGDCWSVGRYASLAELNEELEDYEPAEPLIKNEKIRKAVRAWAEANNINSRYYYDNDMKFNSSERKLTWIDTTIQFNELGALEGLEDGKRYTVDELCGEEEE